jgi:hypothetical protein
MIRSHKCKRVVWINFERRKINEDCEEKIVNENYSKKFIFAFKNVL